MTAHRLLALSFAAALAVAGCKGRGGKSGEGEGGDDDSADEKTPDERVLVEISTPSRADLRQSVVSTGTVHAERQADVLVGTTGDVVEIGVEEGAVVRQGQLLARVENAQVEGELLRARLAEARARETHDGLKGLVAEGFVARNSYEDAAHTWDTARVALQQAEAAAALRELRAPIDGTVVRRDLRWGEAVAPPKLAFQVLDLDSLQVDLHLPERELARVAVGQDVVLRSEVLPEAGRGTVLRLNPIVDAQSGTVRVTVAVAPGQPGFRVGMFLRAEVVVAVRPQALTVPKRALVWDDGVPHVFAVEGDKAKRLVVTLGIQDEDVAEVAAGLADGARIVTLGQALLKDGAVIRTMDEASTGGEATPTTAVESTAAAVQPTSPAIEPTPTATPAPEPTPIPEPGTATP